MKIEEYIPRINKIPRVNLVERITPVFKLTGLSEEWNAEIWVKDDGATSSLYGGNKPRKLEFLLAQALQRGCEKVVTSGGTGTHHGIATAVFAKKLGMKVSLHLFEQFPTPHSTHNFEWLKKNVEEMHIHKSPLKAFTKAFLQSLKEEKTYHIPPGGSNSLSDLGYIIALFELFEQMEKGECPFFDFIFVPGGSLGTATGIILGTSLLGLKWSIIVVRVVDIYAVNPFTLFFRLKRGKSFLKKLGARNFHPVNYVIDNSCFGEAYGKPTPECEESIGIFEKEGVFLEEIYTGKTASSLQKLVKKNLMKNKKVLFWKTNSPSLPAL